MTLRFRNLAVSPDDPVDRWGVEGLATAIDRGGLADWRRITRALRADPHGKVAADLEQAMDIAEDRGVVEYMRTALARARMTDKERVGQRISEYVTRTGLSQAEFARRLGTSPSRFSTYASGKVSPSAVLMERMRLLASRPPGPTSCSRGTSRRE